MDDNSGSSGSPSGGNFAAPADKGAQRRADMRRMEQERRRREAVRNLINRDVIFMDTNRFLF